MAVLNKIRQRSVFLIIIIALALFSFVLADVIRNGGFSSQKDQNTIATVNGEEVSRENFARQVEAYQRNMGSNASTMQAVNQVWEQTLRETILKEELEELGIRAGEAQIKEVMRMQMGNNPAFTNEAGVFDVNRVREYIASLRATQPEAYQQWLQMESNMGDIARQNMYFSMVTAGIGATLTEAEQAYRFQNNSVDLRFVQLPYSSVPDEKVEVTKEEIQNYIQENPAQFETEASRNIRYVFFEEEASTEDIKESKESLTALLDNRVEYNAVTSANDTLSGFNNTTDYEDFVNANSDLPYEGRFKFKNELPSEFADELFSLDQGETFGPYKDNGYFKISKLVETKEIPDSTKASHILVAYQGQQFAPDVTRTKEEAEALADSLAAVIRNDKGKFAELAAEFSSDRSNNQDGGDLGYFGPGAMVPAFDNFILENNAGDIGVVETDFGYHVIHIEEQTEREKAVKIATIARELQASERSRNNLYNETTKFEIAAGDGDFAKVAEEGGYNIRTVNNVKALDENIPGIGQQRRVVQWAFEDEANVGDIKRFDIPSGYVVAQITSKNKEGLMSVENASSEVIPILVKREKAAILKEQINSNNLQEIASNHNVIVQTANAVNLANPTLPGAGSEPEVVGAVFALEPGSVSEPIAGEKGVYVVELESINEVPAMNSYSGIAEQETAERRQRASQRLFEALREKAEIEDNRARFY
ncbi:peptidylprolyl isomerase/peptidyl-prolyl cis-trans isomerase D [Salegentibacter sp. 24]|jgi:peptidylprolyl isomerase/peptidyl-prolyl cis-trans isomerase D|uniref:peptidylprolyl isomerase n=1 Tax=Salegentibacter sp. 24 TaxID=2183986 RepID=UPI001060FF49|nr:peptidylprolyl isomerase [Salegentibacter sp. 24]TDN95327.1 peptidylprolyl isomerase/peptidyl-prolyl cis-trans isomerase D [Salegentibacter sp. 24]